ncbi:MAG: alpha/beta hydrolase [Actinomycetota bacterium]|nr:alpha/beta hydrolase [Actinomycetota bacterium]
MVTPVEQTSWAPRRRTSTSYGEIAWDSWGEGPPVVLVHGTPSRAFLWRGVAPELAERFCVYVYDLLGYGDSQRRLYQDVSLTTQARVLAELVRQWELQPPALVGHDIGAAVVLRAHLLESVAARRLALIDAVVLRPWITETSRHIQRHMDCYRTMPSHIFEQIAAAHLRTATAQPMDEDTLHTYLAPWEGTHGQRMWLAKTAQFDERETAELEPLLESMTTPTRVIWGEHDAWLDPSISDRIVERLPDADQVLIPGAGHFSMEDNPADVAAALADFLTPRRPDS